jgi:iron complex transport system permease protein
VASAGVGAVDPGHVAVLWNIRFPRVLLALVVGASLGCAGAAMQGVFGNPLAEPGIVGVSSGAAVAAVAAIVTGITALGPWTLPAAAFGGGLATTAAVYALAGAAIGLCLFVADDAELRQVTFWNPGSLGAAAWRVSSRSYPWLWPVWCCSPGRRAPWT